MNKIKVYKETITSDCLADYLFLFIIKKYNTIPKKEKMLKIINEELINNEEQIFKKILVDKYSNKECITLDKKEFEDYELTYEDDTFIYVHKDYLFNEVYIQVINDFNLSKVVEITEEMLEDFYY